MKIPYLYILHRRISNCIIPAIAILTSAITALSLVVTTNALEPSYVTSPHYYINAGEVTKISINATFDIPSSNPDVYRNNTKIYSIPSPNTNKYTWSLPSTEYRLSSVIGINLRKYFTNVNYSLDYTITIPYYPYIDSYTFTFVSSYGTYSSEIGTPRPNINNTNGGIVLNTETNYITIETPSVSATYSYSYTTEGTYYYVTTVYITNIMAPTDLSTISLTYHNGINYGSDIDKYGIWANLRDISYYTYSYYKSDKFDYELYEGLFAPSESDSSMVEDLNGKYESNKAEMDNYLDSMEVPKPDVTIDGSAISSAMSNRDVQTYFSHVYSMPFIITIFGVLSSIVIVKVFLLGSA